MAWRQPGDKPLSEPMMANELNDKSKGVKTVTDALFNA